jgi:hypothetical protein
MSYGRNPYYIFSDGENMHFYGPNVSTSVPEDAIAQLIATMANRGNDDDLDEFVERGKKLRPQINPDLKVMIANNGWIEDEKENSKQTKETRQETQP